MTGRPEIDHPTFFYYHPNNFDHHPRYPELPEAEATEPVGQVAEVVAWLQALNGSEVGEFYDRQYVLEQVETRLTEILERVR